MRAGASIVVVNFNGRSELGELLDSLAVQSLAPREVILVDNASEDGSPDYVRRTYPWVDLVETGENLGFAGGVNAGAERARGDLLVLINNDAVADSEWLAELVGALEAEPGAAAAVPRIHLAGEPDVYECAGADFDNLGFCWGRGSNERDTGQYHAPSEVAGVTGCSLALRRSALAGEPVFDPDFFMYYEELDLSLRLRGRGHRILYVPSAVAFHKRSRAVGRAVTRPRLFQQFYGNRNRLKILAKYYPVGLLLRNLPLIAMSYAYWNLYFLRHGGPRLFLRAVFQQLAFLARGLGERRRHRVAADRWLPWMTRHTLGELWRARAERRYAA